jgi:hypothetical protein
MPQTMPQLTGGQKRDKPSLEDPFGGYMRPKMLPRYEMTPAVQNHTSCQKSSVCGQANRMVWTATVLST